MTNDITHHPITQDELNAIKAAMEAYLIAKHRDPQELEACELWSELEAMIAAITAYRSH